MSPPGSRPIFALSCRHSRCTAIAPGMAPGDRSTVRRPMEHRLIACVAFAPSNSVFQSPHRSSGMCTKKRRVETHKRQDNANPFNGRMVFVPEEMAFVPEGQADSSQARSATGPKGRAPKGLEDSAQGFNPGKPLRLRGDPFGLRLHPVGFHYLGFERKRISRLILSSYSRLHRSRRKQSTITPVPPTTSQTRSIGADSGRK
jgi:hypothetical protein